ncbi:MAG: T9SS type A sorting domain-containing protein [Bacteroidetes bacterium]|nr:T9SS type A sorting domain-containing protein [Bacteroidota bacterium]
MKKNRFSIIFKVLVVGLLLYNYNANAQIYNTNDSLRVSNFLMQNSAITGYTNGEQINPAIDNNDPTTWDGFNWTPDIATGLLRLVEINIPNKNLSGNLNLTNCQYLTYIYCNNNQIKSIIVNDMNNISILNCAYNAIEIMDLSPLLHIQQLFCQYNDLTFLDIHNANNLTNLNAEGNKLSFNQLKMPNNQESMNKAFWNIGQQKEFIPAGLTKIGEQLYCEGMLLNLDEVNVNPMNNVTFYRVSISTPLVEGVHYYKDNNNFSFIDGLAGETIYCVITNTTTHHNLIMTSVQFKLNFIFDDNDVQKIRYFLEQTDSYGAKNGPKVNINYDIDDPYTFNVEWTSVKNNKNQSILRCRTIKHYDSKDLHGQMDLSDMEYLTEIIVANNNINDINFENNTALWYIDVANNGINYINTAQMPQIAVIIADGNTIEEIDITTSYMLAYISINNNYLQEIDISYNNLLKEVYASGNLLENFVIPNESKLERLYINDNLIEEIYVPNSEFLLTFSINNNNLTELDLTQAININTIMCASNNITNLNISGLDNITALLCNYNKLTFNDIHLPTIPLNTITSVMHPQDTIARDRFMCIDGIYYNNENVIDLSEYIYYDTEYYTTYFDVYIVDNAENRILFETNNSGIIDITDYLEGNNIIVEVRCESAFPNLILTTPMFIGYNQYAENDVDKLRTFLDFYSKYGNVDNGLTNGIILTPNYHRLLPSTYPVTWRKVDGIYRLLSIDWAGEEYLKGDLDLSDCYHLVSLNISCSDNLSRNDITLLDLTNCFSISSVLGRYSQLGSLFLENCVSLEELDVYHNKIANPLYINSPTINYVNLGFNAIPSILIDYKLGITHLYVNDNKLTELNVTNASSLLHLDASNNSISNLQFNSFPILRHLNINNNKLSSLNLNSAPLLKELYCNNNILQSLNVQECIELAALECANNNLLSLNLSTLEYLYDLRCANNKLTFASLSYPTIPNVLHLHPQAELHPSCISVQHILECDSLPLLEYFADGDGIIELRYYNDSSLVPNGYYSINNYIVHFTDYLLDTSIYFALTHPHYPDLTLYTVHFNIAPPIMYNDYEVSSLIHFLEQPSKLSGIKNGTYLSENYNVDDPFTYPSVEWIAIGSEFRVYRIKWNERSKLAGNADFSNFYLMDTFQLNGTTEEPTAVNSINTDYLYDLKELDISNNQLTNIVVERSSKLEVLNISNNKLTELDIRNLNNLSVLDVHNNKLIFTTFQLSHRPAELYWYPQDSVMLSNLLPFASDSINCAYQLTENTLHLLQFGQNVRWDISGLNIENDFYSSFSISSGNQQYSFPIAWDNHYIVCSLVGADQYKEDLVLDVVRFWLNLGTGILSQTESFNIYPNPANEYIILNRGTQELESVVLLDINGIAIKKFNISAESIVNLNITDILSGQYFILITTQKNYQIIPVSIVR